MSAATNEMLIRMNREGLNYVDRVALMERQAEVFNRHAPGSTGRARHQHELDHIAEIMRRDQQNGATHTARYTLRDAELLERCTIIYKANPPDADGLTPYDRAVAFMTSESNPEYLRSDLGHRPAAAVRQERSERPPAATIDEGARREAVSGHYEESAPFSDPMPGDEVGLDYCLDPSDPEYTSMLCAGVRAGVAVYDLIDEAGVALRAAAHDVADVLKRWADR